VSFECSNVFDVLQEWVCTVKECVYCLWQVVMMGKANAGVSDLWGRCSKLRGRRRKSKFRPHRPVPISNVRRVHTVWRHLDPFFSFSRPWASGSYFRHVVAEHIKVDPTLSLTLLFEIIRLQKDCVFYEIGCDRNI
jgi:hypothetical protein